MNNILYAYSEIHLLVTVLIRLAPLKHEITSLLALELGRIGSVKSLVRFGKIEVS